MSALQYATAARFREDNFQLRVLAIALLAKGRGTDFPGGVCHVNLTELPTLHQAPHPRFALGTWRVKPLQTGKLPWAQRRCQWSTRSPWGGTRCLRGRVRVHSFLTRVESAMNPAARARRKKMQQNPAYSGIRTRARLLQNCHSSHQTTDALASVFSTYTL